MLIQHQKLIVGLLKTGQQIVDKKQYKRKKILLRGAYPDYGRSMVSRRKKGPEQSGLSRATGTGITGAVLGALIARVISEKPKHMLTGAGIGGLLGAGTGYISGRDEALSNHSKMLWLKRMGVKSLEELPESQDILIDSDSDDNKLDKAAVAIPWKSLLQGVGATAAGGALGYHVMPHLGGYSDVEPSRRLGATLSAATALTLLLTARGFGKGQGLSAGVKAMGKHLMDKTKALAGTAAAIGGEEMIPVMQAAAYRLSNAPGSMATAMQQTADKPTMAQSIGKTLSSPTARGVGAGIGLAGTGGLLTGLLRRKTENEVRKGTSRPYMITKDSLKYMIPAMIAGGVIGSMGNKSNQSQT